MTRSSRDLIVFVGPTLALREARAALDATYLPPVAQGDVYRAARARPAAIAIIDGYFERMPAVWHKEILWALEQGIPVLGASSMGALRAAELCDFGMQGVGLIFEAFRSGALTDDDEVAIAHAPAELGYRSQSLALVNLRATLHAALEQGVVGPETASRLLALAKRTYYPERSYPGLLSAGRAQGLPDPELTRFASFAAQSAVDQKRLDALELLARVSSLGEETTSRPAPEWCLEPTAPFVELQRWAEGQPPLVPEPHATSRVEDAHLLSELRLQNEASGSILRAALARAAAHVPTIGRKLGAAPGHEADDPSPGQQHVAPGAALSRERGAALARLQWRYGDVLATYVADELRAVGSYDALEARALDKQRRLEALGLENPTLAQLGCSPSELLDWFFTTRLGRELPRDIDAYLQVHAYAGLPELIDEAARERAYARFCQH